MVCQYDSHSPENRESYIFLRLCDSVQELCRLCTVKLMGIINWVRVCNFQELNYLSCGMLITRI
jgi:hypothetical protein